MASSDTKAVRKSKEVNPREAPNLESLAVHAHAKITDDGRLDIAVTGDEQSVEEAFEPALEDIDRTDPPQLLPVEKNESVRIPKLNIVIQVVGSRGDVQPFVALGRELKLTGHRVRLATHPTFKTFVEENGLEFFSIGGDPAELMAFMVKNPGLLPGMDSLLAGDVGKRRRDMTTIIDGCWRSCIGISDQSDLVQQEPENGTPETFIADAIIANPPSLAHIHCAEKLQIPLHIMFTMPWSPTRLFSHPLANMVGADPNPRLANYLSFAMVETMIWQGLGDLVNKLRVTQLGLDAIDPTFAPGMLSRLQVPHTYAWSPALIPKPADWASHLSVSGFFFLPLASTYTPPEDLVRFLQAGSPPVYIGFGSIVVQDPDGFSNLIMEAIKKSGVRALVSKGWGGLGSDKMDIPDNIFMLGNCPHDWLFPQVSCVVHHGGAGTTAAGITAGKPTIIVPFFGDQPFWGDMIARAGAGPPPIPFKKLTADNLAAAMQEALEPQVQERAMVMAARIKQENGVQAGAATFLASLPVDKMRCSIFEDQVAVWRFKKSKILLSAKAAGVLTKKNLIDIDDLSLYGPSTYNTHQGSVEPLSGTVRVTYDLLSGLATGAGDVYFGIRNTRSEKLGAEPSLTAASEIQASTTANTTIASSSVPAVASPSAQTKKGLKKLATIPLRVATVDIPMSLSQGLHNVPRLYGDDTVRQTRKVTDWKSGLQAGGEELGLGVYDGFTGVVTQPIKGGRDEGLPGVYKGIGKGLGGLFFKPLAGLGGFFGFPAKGIYEQVRKKHGTSVETHIRVSRIIEGSVAAENISDDEMKHILERWMELSDGLGKRKKKWSTKR